MPLGIVKDRPVMMDMVMDKLMGGMWRSMRLSFPEIGLLPLCVVVPSTEVVCLLVYVVFLFCFLFGKICIGACHQMLLCIFVRFSVLGALGTGN